jgi:hypothetical protein
MPERRPDPKLHDCKLTDPFDKLAMNGYIMIRA